MKFDRELLNTYVFSLLNSADPDLRCVGHNFLIEENVSDERRLEVEALDPNELNAQILLQSYHRKYVLCEESGRIPSTFMMPVNYPALESVVVNPSQKLIRLENIDHILFSRRDRINFGNLLKALDAGDYDELLLLTKSFNDAPGQRPMFAAFEREVRSILRKSDWLPNVIDVFGLYHHYHYDTEKPKHFALMEYTAAEVIEQARANGIEDCFALPTVLESPDNPAFCPVPGSAICGRAVDLRGPFPGSPMGEILHARFSYLPKHLKLLGVLHERELPDIYTQRKRHLDRLREETGNPEFGREWKMR